MAAKQVVITTNTTKTYKRKKGSGAKEQSTYKCPVCGTTMKKT